jgi:hypothetical protein
MVDDLAMNDPFFALMARQPLSYELYEPGGQLLDFDVTELV